MSTSRIKDFLTDDDSDDDSQDDLFFSFPKQQDQFCICDARGLGYLDAKTAIEGIFVKSFEGDPDRSSAYPPDSDVQEGYFAAQNTSKKAELILLAKVKNEICGFIIIAKYTGPEEYKSMGLRPDIAVVKWLAVDPEAKKRGIGTALMIEAMRHAQDAGKKFLSVFFRGPGSLKNSDRDHEPYDFYASFEKKYGIETDYGFMRSMGYRELTYDLDYDFGQLPQYSQAEKEGPIELVLAKLTSGSSYLWPKVLSKTSDAEVRPNCAFYP